MNQIAELKKLYTKTKEILIPKEKKEGEEQAKLTIKQLGLDEISKVNFGENMSPNESIKSIKKIISLSLSVDETELNDLSSGFLEELSGEIMKFSGMENKTDGIKEKLAQRRKQVETEQGGKNVTNRETKE